MIVDSPGVGENNDMNESVLNYLPNAFSFIYVINSTNAGGIQEDRVGQYYTFLIDSSKYWLSDHAGKASEVP